jgi:hypothetical protein
VFVIDGKDHDQQRRDNGMAMASSTSDRWIPFRSVNSRSQGSNSRHEIAKCETTPFRSFGYRELEESRVETLHHRSPEVAKCETSKSRNRHINKDSSFGYRELEVYQKLNSISDTGSWKCRNTSSQKCRNAAMRNAEIPDR